MRYTPYGGSEIFLKRLIDELTRKDHRCHIFANRWVDKDDSDLIFHRVALVRWPSFLRVLSFALSSYLALRGEPLDVTISFDRCLYQDIYRAGDGCHREWLIQRSRILSPFKRFTTYINPFHIAYLTLEKWLFSSRRLKFVVANSNRVKDEIIRHYKLPEEKICVIYNGVTLDRFMPSERGKLRNIYRNKFGVSPDTVLLLFIGSGFERKGLLSLLKALRILRFKSSGIKLLVVGKGDINRYSKIARELEIGSDIIFTGPVSDTIGYYYAGDVFVLPTIYEPFSNACLEAMAASLPVITSRVNGISEILSEGIDGSIIETPLEPEEIARKVLPFLNKAAREAAGMAARKTVENYTIEKTVSEYIALMNKIR